MEYDRITTFTNDLKPIYGSYEFTPYNYADRDGISYKGVKLEMGSGCFQVTRDFGYNGMAAVPDNSSKSYHYEQVAKNDGGYLKAERTDFYKSLGIDFIEGEYEYDITKGEQRVTALGVDVCLGKVLTSLGVEGKAAYALSTLTAWVLDDTLLAPGHYMNKGIVAEVYNEGAGVYESVITVETYVQKENQDGSKYWELVSPASTQYNGYSAKSLLQ